MSGLFRRAGGAWPNLAAILYTLCGWPLGIYLLTRPGYAWNALGVLLTAHTLIYSAYIIHDCAHHAIFRGAAANDRLGVLMSWINGACLANYAGLKKKHLRHHSDRLDVVTFDYRTVVLQGAAWFRQAVLALEWAYVPAVELLMRGFVIAAPFSSGTWAARFATEEWPWLHRSVSPSLRWRSLPGVARRFRSGWRTRRRSERTRRRPAFTTSSPTVTTPANAAASRRGRFCVGTSRRAARRRTRPGSRRSSREW